MGVGGGDIKKAKRWAIYARDAFACVYCGDDLVEILATGGFLTLEHVRARTRGGTHSPSNLMTCCYTCNVDRKARSIKEWWASDLDRPCKYQTILARFSRARKRWEKDGRVYKARAHMLIGNGPAYGSDLLIMDPHPLVAENDARAKRQWIKDPPTWLAAEAEWMESQAELACPCCLRSYDDNSDEPIDWRGKEPHEDIPF